MTAQIRIPETRDEILDYVADLIVHRRALLDVTTFSALQGTDGLSIELALFAPHIRIDEPGDEDEISPFELGLDDEPVPHDEPEPSANGSDEGDVRLCRATLERARLLNVKATLKTN